MLVGHIVGKNIYGLTIAQILGSRVKYRFDYRIGWVYKDNGDIK